MKEREGVWGECNIEDIRDGTRKRDKYREVERVRKREVERENDRKRVRGSEGERVVER
jgi:hypothetical protein